MNFPRRHLLKLGAGAAGLWTTGIRPARLHAGRTKRNIPIGLQLYSVRDIGVKDVPGTIEAVAKMGYQGVEFAGYFGRMAEDLRKMLDRNGLKCCGAHIGLETLVGNAFKATIEFHKTLGIGNLTIHGLPPEHLVSVAAIRDAARLLTEISEKLNELGMQLGYHSQVRDIKPVEERIPIELVFAHAGPNLHMQLDTSHCMEGGADPIALLREFPGRSLSIHLAEYGGPQGAVIGEGKVRWKEVLEYCQTSNTIEWYIVEQVVSLRPSSESAKLCLENLHKMGA